MEGSETDYRGGYSSILTLGIQMRYLRLGKDHLLHIKKEFSVVASVIMEETIVTILPSNSLWVSVQHGMGVSTVIIT